MNDKLKKLYDLYVQAGLIKTTDFETFSSSNDQQIKKLYDIGKQSGLIKTTDYNTFNSTFNVAPTTKKKSTTGSQSVQPKKSTSSVTPVSWMQESLVSSSSQEQKKKTTTSTTLKPVAAKSETVVQQAISGQEQTRMNNGKLQKLYNGVWVDAGAGNEQLGTISKSIQQSRKEDENIFTGYPGKEKNEYRVYNNVWQRRQPGKTEWTTIINSDSINALNKQFNQEVKVGSNINVQLRSDAERKELDNRLATVNSKLIDKEEDEVIKELKRRFPNFKFIEEGTFTDGVIVQSPDGTDKIKISLDNWTFDDDRAEAENLREFIRKNSNNDLNEADKNLRKAEKDMEYFTVKPFYPTIQIGDGYGDEKIVTDPSQISTEPKQKMSIITADQNLKAATKEYVKQSENAFLDVQERARISAQTNGKLDDREVVAAYAALDHDARTARAADRYFQDVSAQSKDLKKQFNEYSSWVDNINEKAKSGEISKEEYESTYVPQMKAELDRLKGMSEKLNDEYSTSNNMLKSIEKSTAENYIIQESKGSVAGGLAYNFTKGLTDIARIATLGNFDAKDQEAIVRLIVGEGTTKEYMSSENRSDLTKVLFSLATSLGQAASGGIIGRSVSAIGGGTKAVIAAEALPFYSGGYYEMKDQFDDPKFKNVSDFEKVMYSTLYGVTSAILEKYGLTKSISKTPFGKSLTSSILSTAIKDLPKDATEQMIKDAVESSVLNRLKSAGVNTLGAFVVEASTESAQKVTELALQETFDWIHGNKEEGYDKFKNGTWKDMFVNTLYEGYLGGLGGGMMQIASSSISGITNGLTKTLNKDQIQVLDNMVKIDGMADSYDSYLKGMVVNGDLTPDEAREMSASFREVKGNFDKIPDDIAPEEKAKAFDLMIERSKIEKDIMGKDESLVAPQKARIAEINNELKTISEDATKKSTEQEVTAEGGGVQREGVVEGQPEVGQGEGTVGQTTEQGTDTGNRTVKGQRKVTGRIAINRPGILSSFGGQQFDTPLEGDTYVEGQRVMFEEKGTGRVYDLGNVNEMMDNEIEGLTQVEESVVVQPDGKLSVDGNNWNIQTDLPTMGIEYNPAGEVTRVSLKDDNGNTTMFDGQKAVDIAYQIELQKIQSPEQQQLINDLLEQDEEFQAATADIELTEAPNVVQEEAVTDTKPTAKPTVTAAAPKITETTDTKAYSEALSEAKAALKEEGNGLDLQVSDVSPEEADAIVAEGGKIFMTEDGLAGAYVKKDGYMGGLFKNPKATYKEVAKLLQQARIKVGGRFMDAYATELEKIYVKNGFRPVARLKFNEEYAPEGWDAPGSALASKPDVVFFAYDPEGKYSIGDGEYVTDYDAAYEMAKNFDAKTANEADRLAAILEKKATVSKDTISKEEINKRVSLAQKALKVILPDVKFVVHDTNEAFIKATGDLSAGAYDPDTKTIHINAKGANRRTVSHEVFHAIIISKVASDVQLQKLTANMVNSVLKSLKQTGTNQDVIDYLERFAAQYKNDPTVMNEEKLAELHGILGENMIELPLPTQNIIKRFLDRLAKMFGLKEMTDREAVEFMNTMSSKVETGKEIAAKEFKKVKPSKTDKFGNLTKPSKSSIENLAKRKQNIVDETKSNVVEGKIVSTRLPKQDDIHSSSKYVVSMDSIEELAKTDKGAEAQYIKIASEISSYGISKIKDVKTFEDAKKVVKEFKESVKSNLQWLYNSFGQDVRDISKLWYDGANKICNKIASEYNYSLEQVSGVMAVLSPQMDWFRNLSLGERVIDIYTKQQDSLFDSKMIDYVKNSTSGTGKNKVPLFKDSEEIILRVKGKKLSELNNKDKAYFIRVFDEVYNSREYNNISPNGEVNGLVRKGDGTPGACGWGGFSTIEKSISILQDGSISNISSNLGNMHKVRNFFNNISNPNDKNAVTIDTHAVAAGLLLPLSGSSKQVLYNFGGAGNVGTGMTGTYPVYADAYRELANDLGLLPREVQSITWEAVRGLFKATFKSNKNNESRINNVWNKYSSGEISLDEAHSEISEIAGGISKPVWFEYMADDNVKSLDENSAAVDQANLDDEGKSKFRKQKPLTTDKDVHPGYETALNALGETEAQIEQWRSENRVNQRQKRNPIVEKAAKDYYNEEITQEEYLDIVSKNQPIKPFKKVPALPTLKEVVNSLDKNKVEKGIVGLTKNINDGERVASRLDIPAYETYDTWVVSVHDGVKEGKSIAYGQTAVLNNVEFKSFSGPAIKMAMGVQNKTPIARMFGNWVNEDPEAVHARAKDLMNDPEWVQVGMNPFRHSWFYDKSDGMPLASAEEVVQVGALVLAKNPVKVAPSDPMFETKSSKGGRIRFQKPLQPEAAEKLTEDGNGNYVFNHYSDKKRDVIKPGTGQNNITSREEASALSAVNGLAQYYTMDMQKEPGTGPNQHTILIPKDRVYYFNKDQEDFYDEAKRRFEEVRPGQAFSPNYQVAFITQVANENGYDMVVANWRNGELRAQTTMELTPSDKIINFKPLKEVKYEVGDTVQIYGDIVKITAIDGDIITFKGETSGGSVNFKRSPKSIQKVATPKEQVEEEVKSLDEEVDIDKPKFRKQKASDQAAVIVKTGKEAGLSDAGIREYMKRNGYTDRQATDAIQAYNDKKEGIFIDPNWSKLRKAAVIFKRRFLSSRGLMPNSAFASYEQSQANTAKDFNKAEKILADFNRAMNKVPKADKDKVRKDFDEYVRGDKSISLPLDLKKSADAMRANIDSISISLINSGVVDEHLAQKIKDNLGSYFTRSYRVHDRANWKNEVEENIKQKAINLLKIQYMEIAKEKAAKENMDVQEALDNLVTNALNDMLTKSGAENFVSGGKKGSKDLSILKERQDIPLEIRMLMGEYTDPAQNYARTILKMSALAANHQFLTEVKKNGTGVFLFEKNDPRRPKNFDYEIAAEGSETMNPLNGMYTTKEIGKQFEEQSSQLKGVLKWTLETYMRLLSSVKWGKTIGSLMTHAKNVFGNIGFILVNGHWRVNEMGRAYKTVKNDLFSRDKAGLRDYMNKLIELGIVKQSAGIGELRAMFKDADWDTAMIERINKNTGSKWDWVKSKFSKGAKFMEDMYQAEDDFFKIVAYENELSRYSKAMFGKSKDELTVNERAEVDKVVAEIVKNTYPTYSRIPELVNMIRRLPFIGNFISFQAESYRTAFNTAALSLDEIKSENPGVRQIGAQRLVGSITYMSAKTAILSAFSNAVGMGAVGILGYFTDDEEEKQKEDDVRKFLPEWSKNSDLLMLKASGGKIKYVDFSSSDPHGGINKAINSLLIGEKSVDGLINAMGSIIEPFIGEEMTTAAILAVKTNKNAYGKPIYNPEDTFYEKFKDISAHMLNTVQPGTVSTIRRAAESEGLVNELVGASTGMRIYEIDVADNFGYSMITYGKRIEDAKRIYNSEVYSKDATKESISDAKKRAEKAITNINKQIYGDYYSALRLGANEDVLFDNLKRFGRMSLIDMKFMFGEVPYLLKEKFAEEE